MAKNQKSGLTLAVYNRLKQLVNELHGIAGGNLGMDSDSLMKSIEALNGTNEGETLLEAIQARGLLMYDQETRIKVDIRRIPNITGTPKWKKALLADWETDTNRERTVAQWIDLVYPEVDPRGKETPKETAKPAKEATVTVREAQAAITVTEEDAKRIVAGGK